MNWDTENKCNFAFKYASPLGFMIDDWGVKGGLHGDKSGLTPDKNVNIPEKNVVRPYFSSFNGFLSKILKNDCLVGMIKFRKFFEMIFSLSEMSIFQKIQAMILYCKITPFFSLKTSLFYEKENETHSVMIRGKSPRFRNEGAGVVIRERGIIAKRTPIIPKCRLQRSYRKKPSIILKCL